jgi:DNA-directed RNA polymerase subunit RPC12/RpoP
VRFACDQCGRAYAAAEELRGRAFRMRCKGCGHLLVVRPGRAPAREPQLDPEVVPRAAFDPFADEDLGALTDAATRARAAPTPALAARRPAPMLMRTPAPIRPVTSASEIWPEPPPEGRAKGALPPEDEAMLGPEDAPPRSGRAARAALVAGIVLALALAAFAFGR